MGPTVVTILAVVAAVAAAWLWLGRQKSAAALQVLRREHDELRAAHTALEHKERDAHKKHEERAEELRELKHELAGLKKRMHAAQEADKQLRKQMREQVDERDKLLSTRPAFEPPPPEPKKEAPRPPPEPRIERVVDEAAAQALAELQQTHAALLAERDADRKAVREAKQRAARLERYTEQLRRIEVVGKSKVEVLEDKLATMGRKYYDAVSELAALKGEVAPVRPAEASSGHEARGHDDRSQALGEALEAASAEADVKGESAAG